MSESIENMNADVPVDQDSILNVLCITPNALILKSELPRGLFLSPCYPTYLESEITGLRGAIVAVIPSIYDDGPKSHFSYIHM